MVSTAVTGGFKIEAFQVEIFLYFQDNATYC